MRAEDTCTGMIARPGPPQAREIAHLRSLVVTLPMPEVLLSVNQNQRLHWRVRGRHAKAQREAAMLAAFAAMSGTTGLRGVMFPAGKVKADVTVYRRRNQKVPDENSQWEWCKPIWDGFQDAGVVGNDKQIGHGTMAWEPTNPEPRVVVVLTEVY